MKPKPVITIPDTVPPIPWQPFREEFRTVLDSTVMALWFCVHPSGLKECFVGRVSYWTAADSAVIARRSGSMVFAREGQAWFAIITEPEISKPKLDDAINVSASLGSRGSIEAPAGLAAVVAEAPAVDQPGAASGPAALPGEPAA